MRTCTKCKKEKPKTEFNRHSSCNEGLHTQCKSCCYERSNDWAKRNPDKVRGYCKSWEMRNRQRRSTLAAIWRKNNKDKHRESVRWAFIKREYGLTRDSFSSLLLSQGGGCAICGTSNPGGVGSFHVDHNHITGVVRGLLCSNCNVAIGFLSDSASIAMRAMLYLESNYPAPEES